MSYLWLTADTHLGHRNALNFCNRPYMSLEDMNDGIIRNANERIKPEDTVFCVGDFYFRGGNNSKDKAEDYEARLNGKWIFIEGNHDRKNKMRGMIYAATMSHSGLKIMMRHIPPDVFPEGFDVVICGHVHTAWKHIFVDGKPVINVGVDMWNYRPVRIDELVKYYQQIKKANC